MIKPKLEHDKTFLVLAITQTILASLILINELLATNPHNRVPGGYFPIEHHSSWARVCFFCGAAVIGLLISWIFKSRKSLGFLPSVKSILLLSVLVSLLSIQLNSYFAEMGWCCEQPLAFFFGFPFSFMLGIAGYNHSALQQYANYGLFQVLGSTELQIAWRFRPFQFFLDFLFWSNLILVLLSLASPFMRRYRLTQNQKKLQAEGN
jgi:hypothetical protein